ncbi:Glutathione S-transferase omega-like 2 [Hondaea fermentalgiana]|uniref:Glutathione S-transferase omega-like 2 n=1 Tax=Hondaea fermentalgiana TaxID=2315210 RepID=A0A2R5GGZ6_9STRA|nr:Glutathione S-transferase omega-like 2 [Hondaea fermentalgiana]|eukprot:GBG29028.1 Glutathione S-transferase omega-like 2 [Hondaea fermentalgiana]
MVHVIDGEVKPGHFPRKSDSYERRTAAFKIDEIPAEDDQDARIEASQDRYHLIVCAACPWAHRTLLVRAVKDLTNISVSVVSPFLDDETGWAFASEDVAAQYKDSALPPTRDLASGEDFSYLHQLYTKVDPEYTGNVTTPVLYDKVEEKIVSNESWDIVRYLDRAFKPGPNAVPGLSEALYPENEAQDIDSLATWVQDELNNGVYKCGLAKSQRAYEEALDGVFACLDELEDQLAANRYLCGRDDQPSLADLQLLPTLLRFDDVYHILFKAARRRLSSYRNLFAYARDLYQVPAIRATVDFAQCKDHYYTHFVSANPKQVVPIGSVAKSFDRPHDRDRFVRQRRDSDTDEAREQKASQDDQTNKDSRKAKGEFVRGVSGHRRIITPDGEGEGELPAEAGRYHLYIANNCPWCHRTMMARAVLGLEDVISVDVLFYRRDEDHGWQFLPDEDGLRDFEIERRKELLDGQVSTEDSINGLSYAPEIYQMFGSKERSVPILFDKQANEIVNNESSEIVRMFALGFKAFHRDGAPDLYPAALADEIDQLNAWIYPDINNGAYRAGFSSDPKAYEDAFYKYFAAFDRLEDILRDRRFLTGEHPTEADIRLLPTIVRHDPVYYSRMKLNDRMVLDSPHLYRWLQDMLRIPGVLEATNIDHCILGYFGRTGNALVPPRPHDNWY